MIYFVAENTELSEFVRKILADKNLSTYDVQRNSGNKISAATITKIINKEIRSSNLQTLSALAKGLGIPEMEVFRVARGLSSEKPIDRIEILAETFDNRDLSKSDWLEIEAVIKVLIEQKTAAKR